MNYIERINNIIKNNNIKFYNDIILQYKNINIINNIPDKDIKDRLNKICNLVYLQNWNKLHIINKKIKIEEYISTLDCSEDIKKTLLDKLNIKLNEKKLTQKLVEYDTINGKILEIFCIKKEDDKYIIN